VKIAYESSPDDYAEWYIATHLRTRQRRRANLLGGIVIGAFTSFLVASVMFSFERPLVERALVAIVAGVIVFWISTLSNWRDRRREFAEYAKGLRGTAEPIAEEVSIDDSGFTIKALGSTLCIEWGAIILIDAASEYIHILGCNGYGTGIPNRAFADSSVRSAFLDRTRRYRANAPGHWYRVGIRKCRSCGYDLFGSEGERCPECGAVIGLPAVKGANHSSVK
jgi:hypothetical protein